MESTTVYVGNLNFDTTVAGLSDFLELSCTGVVDVDLQKRHSDDRSKGWALVSFASADEAQMCVERLNSASLDGRNLVVRMDRKSGGNPQIVESALPSTRVYAGNLAWAMNDDELMEIFGPYNPIAANIAYGRDGRSRGYAIVEFGSVEEATSAIDGLNEQEQGGRSMHVRFDTRGPANSGGSGGSGQCSVYVRNLPEDVSWKALKDVFSELRPQYANVKTGRDGASQGWGTVRFATPEAASEAIERFNGFEMGSRSIEVRLDTKAG